MIEYLFLTQQPYPHLQEGRLKSDVVAIYDTIDDKVTEYAYDAYGNCTIIDNTNSTIASANPFRYRGYYLDSETGWYFLNARVTEWNRIQKYPQWTSGMNENIVIKCTDGQISKAGTVTYN